MEKSYSFPGIGSVILRKSRRARRVSIRISQKGEVKVVIPYVVSYREGIGFLEKKEDWVKRTLRHIHQKKPPELVFRPGENIFTKHHKLILKPVNRNKFMGKIQEDITILLYPSSFTANEPKLREIISRLYVETLRVEARRYLPIRVSQLAEKYGYSYHKVFLKNMKTRWGSCSAARNINLNIHLMHLPSHLIDYIILHELVHTVHKNHGPGFWQELEKITGNARILDKELNNYRIEPEIKME